MHQALKQKAETRNISNILNKTLAEYFTKKENVFGIMQYPPITPGNITGLSNFT